MRKAKLDLKKSLRKDYYKILGVEEDADAKSIKKAYLLLARRYHPDKNTESQQSAENAELQFKEVAVHGIYGT